VNISDDFFRRVADHEMTVRHDDGLYRHIQFSKPGTCIDRFDLVTWPGHLCYCGDMGTYVFARVPDMFTFFRKGGSLGDPIRFDAQYWAEKCEARDRDGIKQYSPERFRYAVVMDLRQFRTSRELPLSTYKRIRQAVYDDVLSVAEEGEHEAMKAAMEFDQDGFNMYDFYEHDVTEYTFRFLWCCHAIVWGIRKYDAAAKAVEGER
jgi:hypothetical protein